MGDDVFEVTGNDDGDGDDLVEVLLGSCPAHSDDT